MERLLPAHEKLPPAERQQEHIGPGKALSEDGNQLLQDNDPLHTTGIQNHHLNCA